MEWEKVDQNITLILDDLLFGYECKKKPMFGSPVYFVNDNMCTGGIMQDNCIHQDDMELLMNKLIAADGIIL